MKTKILSTVALVLFSFSSFSYNEVSNGSELRQRLGLLSNYDLSNIKIAIIDNGFDGFKPGKGMLPDSAELIEPPLKVAPDNHGLGMAQILWEATGKSQLGPKIYLLNSNGFTNFKHAVNTAIEKKVDIVLYAQVWSFGGNFDGKGFINAEVDKAVSKGILWINAAGNVGNQVFNGTSGLAGTDIVISNKFDDNSFTLTLSWNDFSDSEAVCTVKDLDFFLLDIAHNELQKAQLIQSGTGPDPKDPKDPHSCYARETLKISKLERGDFILKVVKKSGNIGPNDLFRIVITDTRPDAVTFKSKPDGYEIFPPADNSRVFTVGEKTPFSAMGPTTDGRIKPDVIVENTLVSFTNGAQVGGSSNAAAMVAASVAVLKASNPKLSVDSLINYAISLRNSPAKIPAGLQQINPIPQWVKNLIPSNGYARLDPGTGRVVILSHEPPAQMPLLQRFNLRPTRTTDIIACMQNMSSCGVYQASDDYNLKPPFVEFRRLIPGSDGLRPGLWKIPLSL